MKTEKKVTPEAQESKSRPARKSEITGLRAEIARLQTHNESLMRQLANARDAEKNVLEVIKEKELYAKLWALEEARAVRLEKKVNELDWKSPKFEIINFKPRRKGGAA